MSASIALLLIFDATIHYIVGQIPESGTPLSAEGRENDAKRTAAVTAMSALATTLQQYARPAAVRLLFPLFEILWLHSRWSSCLCFCVSCSIAKCQCDTTTSTCCIRTPVRIVSTSSDPSRRAERSLPTKLASKNWQVMSSRTTELS
jgi:hypothetical protein